MTPFSFFFFFFTSGVLFSAPTPHNLNPLRQSYYFLTLSFLCFYSFNYFMCKCLKCLVLSSFTNILNAKKYSREKLMNSVTQGITSLYCNEIFSSLPLIEKQILDIPLIFGSQTPCPPLYPFIVK